VRAARPPPAAAAAIALLLISCATKGASPGPSFTDLPGWKADDHAAALVAFQASCVATRTLRPARACARAAALSGADEAQARRFFESNFTLEAAAGPGLLTAYYAPVYQARRFRVGDFTAPVRPRPADLPPADWGAGGGAPYADRAAIEAAPAAGALAWMRPEELFLLQVQGSGALVFDDGRRTKVGFAGTNGAPYLAVGAVMRQRGLIGSDASADDIRAWLAANRGEGAEAIMRLDPRYVFFRLAPDDGTDPVGAAGVRLIAGRAIAVDPAAHALGELLWLDAASPTIAGAFLRYRRLTVALDTGAAIRGSARADLYLGRSPAAGLEAGRVRHVL
jgi:membrane-bound lytic murein transglycosylase A